MSGLQLSAKTVEIAGVAGSGKSTLSRVLCSGWELCRLDGSLRLRDPRHLPYAMHSLPRLAPLLWRCFITTRFPSWTELKLLIYVMEWDRSIERQHRAHTGATIIDQGPVYALARLGCVDPPIAGTEAHGRWWTAAVERWAHALDAIIWLDAPTEVLWARIRGRVQGHAIQDRPKLEGLAFLDRYRRSYETVLGALQREGGPRVLRYDTSRHTAAQIASHARERIERSA